MARENAVFEASIDVKNKNVEIRHIRTGETFTIYGEKVSHENQIYGMLHGWKQRAVDNTAVERKAKDGHIRTDAEMDALRVAGLRQMVEHLNSGSKEWTVREPGKGAARKPVFDLELVIRAAMALTGKDYATIRGHIERRAKTASTTMAAIVEAWVGQDARLGAKVAEMRVAAADASLSAGMLDELMD